MEAKVQGSVSLKSNKLLALLDPDVAAHLIPRIELVNHPPGTVIHEPGQALRHALFPVSGLIGRVATTADGKSTELTLCGCEGMIGMSIILGGRPLGALAMALTTTVVFQVPASAMVSAWRESEAFQRVMLHYVQAMLQEVIQIALCNKHHTVEQQLSRWLAIATERLGNSHVHVTHSLIAQLLGVRREGITEAAGKLEAQGVLRHMRGELMVLDRAALVARCCECYEVIKRNHQATMGEVSAPDGSR